MRDTITFDAVQKRITIVVSPPVQQQDALNRLREIRTHPEFRADYGIVCNLLEPDHDGRQSVPNAVDFSGAVRALFPGQKVAVLSAHALTTHRGFMAESDSTQAALQSLGE